MIATAALWIALAACGDTRLHSAPPVLARVDGEEIAAPELQRELHRLKRENGALARSEDELDRVRRTLLDRLVDRRLLLAECKRRALVVTHEEVQQALAKKRAGYPGAAFDEEVARTEMTRAELEDRVREDLLIHRLVRAESDAATLVTAVDAQRWYDAHSEEFDMPEQVHARQIVTKTEEHAQQIQDALSRGADFGDLARKHSLSPDGKQGGDLGFFARGIMPRVFDDVCFGLPPRKVSAVVASTYGYHLFEVLERRPAQRRAFAQARPEIEARLGREKAAEAQNAFLARLRENARIKVDADVLGRVR